MLGEEISMQHELKVLYYCSWFTFTQLYWIYALLLQKQPCRNYALWEAFFGQNLLGGITKSLYRTGPVPVAQKSYYPPFSSSYSHQPYHDEIMDRD